MLMPSELLKAFFLPLYFLSYFHCLGETLLPASSYEGECVITATVMMLLENEEKKMRQYKLTQTRMVATMRRGIVKTHHL